MTTPSSASHVRVQRSTRVSQISLAILVVIIVALAVAPFFIGRGDIRLMIEIFYYLALAQMWNLLAGYAGLVSVGQQAYVGLGGYMLFMLAVMVGINPLLALPVVGVLTALIAIPTGLVAFRLRGAYFAIGTWVIAEVFRLVFAQVSALGGGSGMSLPAGIVRDMVPDRSMRDPVVYWVALGICVGSMAAVWLLLRSKWGLALTAIRDSENASESLGVPTYRTKFLTYVLVAGVTGVIGALIFLQKLRISPDAAFSVNDWTAFVIFIVVIGGIGTLEGPIIGTIAFFLLREIGADWGSYYLILLGAIAVGIMLKAPQGIWGLIAQRYDLHLFPVGYRLKPPS